MNKRYLIGWRKHDGGYIRMMYYQREDMSPDSLTKTELIGRAWSTDDQRRAQRLCRHIIESWHSAGRFAYVIEMDERELFLEGLKGK